MWSCFPYFFHTSTGHRPLLATLFSAVVAKLNFVYMYKLRVRRVENYRSSVNKPYSSTIFWGNKNFLSNLERIDTIEEKVARTVLRPVIPLFHIRVMRVCRMCKQNVHATSWP